jgi:hypothetical protein
VTCIAVVRGPDGVFWMGADSCISRGSSRWTLASEDSKVFALADDVWFAWTGYSILGPALRHGFSLPERVVGESDQAWVTVRLIPAMRQHLIEAGVYSEETDPSDDAGWQRGIRGEAVLVVRRRMFYLSQILLATQIDSDYLAIGSGEDVALGALHTAMELSPTLSPESMLASALSAAATHADGVAPPYLFTRCAQSEVVAEDG